MPAPKVGPNGTESATIGAATSQKVVRLPQLQPHAEYSTLRLAKLQPSAKLKSWDARLSGAPLNTVLPPAPISARGERSGFGQSQDASTVYPYTSREQRSQSQSLSRSLRFDSQMFSLDHEELSSYCLRGREAEVSQGPVPSGAAPGMAEEESQHVETVPPHLVQIRAMYSPKAKEETVDGEDSVPLGESATTPVHDMAITAAEDLLQGQPDEEWDEEAMLKKELAKLHTGEDVIAFFAKNGSNSSVKFVYCKRKEHVDPREFRPYDLEIISELMEGSAVSTATKLGEHFTISATGVVHVCPGQQSEHMSLGDWRRGLQ